MQHPNKTGIKEILPIVAQFLEDPTSSIPEKYLSHPKIFHYYKEIVRYWNQLNFIIRRTLQALNQLSTFNQTADSNLQAAYFYATYRITRENALDDVIYRELNTHQKNLGLEFRQFLKKLQTFSWERALHGKSTLERLSIEEAVPSFVIIHLQPVMSFEFLRDNLHFMNAIKERTEITVRINDLDAEPAIIESIQDALTQKQISIRQDPDIPELFHVPAEKKLKILQNKWYKSGRLIIQDKASAAVVQVLNPKPDDLICDMCAAPGIKTSQVGQKMRNSGVILASDVHSFRMFQMKNLKKSFHLRNTHLINADSINLPVNPGHLFDRVLLDAPCTGSGTFLTNPELKWRQNNVFLTQMQVLQRKLLKTASSLLKPKGILVYSTCSLYPEEGEFQIFRFLKEFKPSELPNWLSASYLIDDAQIPGTGRLFPAKNNTQGFFIAKFQKK
ncbi:MAG: RsmB/NOP family class I SAM-dependent RNA methyltransferase [Candidatus Helarchaeota archaeon]|nr:RsmB/NOP family class I SAM-dependent RNA methyltransferase [Candidatus Helarchaeota archaeon]